MYNTIQNSKEQKRDSIFLNRKNMKAQKGYIFTLDALLALIVLVTGMILIAKYTYVETVPEKQAYYVSEDILNLLAQTKVSESRNPYVMLLVENGTITRLNTSLLEQIGYFWVQNQTDLAMDMIHNLTSGLVPEHMDVQLFAESTQLYSTGTPTRVNHLVVSKSLISGIALDKPIEGTSARIYLTDVDEQLRTDYVYFGGFEGEGNITKRITLPSVDDILEIYLELDSQDDIDIRINDYYCTRIDIQFTNISSSVAEGFDLTNCSSQLTDGTNTFLFEFANQMLNTSYIGGGFIRVKYKTSELYNKDFTTHDYSFPGIEGIMNLYSSSYVPGNLNNIEISLHYVANNTNTSNTLVLTLGDTIVYEDHGSSGVQTVTIDDANLSSVLDYSTLSGMTIPIRFGFENLSYQSFQAESQGKGDSVVITDESGSMAWRMDSDTTGTTRSCTDANFDDPSTTRMSVAKCVDKDFVHNMLENITGNRVGLVSYSYDTNDILNLTDNITALENEINAYNPNGATCTSCGIYDATQLLLSNYLILLHDSSWMYSLDYQSSDPPSSWKAAGFNDSSWLTGTTSIGFPSTDTVITTPQVYPNIWDMALDRSTPEVDFTSGFNSTANTFGTPLTSARDDGWDSKTGTYDYSSGQIDGLVSGRLRIYGLGTSDSSAAYGIQMNITPEIYALISSGALVKVSFSYEWNGNNPQFESSDQVWIKARFTQPSGTSYYLGSNLDSSHSGKDSSLEIATQNDPDYDFSGTALVDVTSYITGPGYYYLDFGGKLDRSSSNEYGYFYFDNILISVTDSVGDLYFRNTFTVDDLSEISTLTLFVSSDDYAEVYLNEQLIDNDTTSHSASYWNRQISVDKNELVEGTNILAVKLWNDDAQSAAFDVQLKASEVGRGRAMLVMSDGVANYCHGPNDGAMDTNGLSGDCSDSSAKQEAIDFACYAHTQYNISIYAVAFGSTADTATLQSIASCDNASHFYYSDNVTGLQEIYQTIAASLVDLFVEQEAQVISVEGNITQTILYPDSYIRFNYTSTTSPITYGEVPIFFEEHMFQQGCAPTYELPYGIRVIDAKVSSYSGVYWTNRVQINNNTVFNLSTFNENYTLLGDPFIIPVDPGLFVSGDNMLGIYLGLSEENTSSCSRNDSFIYTGTINLLNISLPYSTVLPLGVGCVWTIQFDDNSTNVLIVPGDYTGSKTCSYTNGSISYDTSDSYDVAMYNLLSYLDFDSDGRVFVNFDASDLVIDAKIVEQVPYLWGPSVIEVRTLQ